MNPILEYRLRHGLSRQELAGKLGVSHQLIGHIERGIRQITAENARDWSVTLGIRPVVLRPDLFGPLPRKPAKVD